MNLIRTPMTYVQALMSYLPRMVAEAAINNRIRQEGEGHERDKIDGELNNTLSSAFHWDSSPERRKYWETVNGEFLRNIESEEI